MTQPPQDPYGQPPQDPYGSQDPNPAPPVPPVPGADQPPPAYGAPQPPVDGGAQPPLYPGQQPPPYPSGPADQTPPGYGQVPPGYGQVPPGYSAPPAGGYGQYGAPDPSAGYAAYQQPGFGGAGAPLAPVDTIKAGWEVFKTNPAVFILAPLVWGLLIAIPASIMYAIVTAGATTTIDPNTGRISGVVGGLGLGALILITLVVIVFGILSSAALLRGTLKAADGHQVTFADFFKFTNVGQVLLLSLIVGVASSLLAITVIGGLAVAFFALYAVYFVIDQNMGAIDALKASFRTALAKPGDTIIFMLLIWLVNVVGSLACGVGVLVSGPVALLASAFWYRSASGTPRR